MKHRYLILLLFIFFQAELQAQWINVRESGADDSGQVKCTDMIRHLIDSLAEKGGGTLYFPSGTFLTGPIIMRTNITLYLDAGAVIRFSDDFDDYLPMVPTRWEEVRVKNFLSPIYAYRSRNMSIRGDGHFEGQGQRWWDAWFSVRRGEMTGSKWQEYFINENEELLKKNEHLQRTGYFLRPPLLTMYECQDILIEGVSFSNPPFWTLMPAFCDNVTITGITIENPGESPNTDGIDISSCRNVHISNCHISVGDDCIVIKSGRDEDGREADRPTENVTITNCTMLKGHGGVVIGSEMSGDVRRVAISNCTFEGTDRGIRLKTMRGRGGVIEDVRVSNVVMYNIVDDGITINLRYQPADPEPFSERTPVVRNIHISDMIIRNAGRAITIYGLEESVVSQVSFRDMEISAGKGILIEHSSGISFNDVRMNITEGSLVDCHHSSELSFDKLSTGTLKSNIPFYTFTDCSMVRVSNNYFPGELNRFIEADEKCGTIYLVNNILPNARLLSTSKKETVIIGSNEPE